MEEETDYFDDQLFKVEREQFEKHFEEKRKIAVKYNWNYTNFKRFIGQFLIRKNDEDQWVFDYDSWVLTLKPDYYEHPSNWAEEFYGKDWDLVKMNKSLESLKRIACGGK